jgi:hypothetical protein
VRSTRAEPAERFQPRDPANELYDRACDVVAAAAELRDASTRDNNDAAAAATLGCLEAALSDLAFAIEALRESSLRRIAGASPALGDQAAVDAHSAREKFDAAVAAVRAAGAACSQVRATAGPLLAELSRA